MLRDASGRIVMTKGWKAFLITMAIIVIAAITVLSVFLGISKSQEAKWMATASIITRMRIILLQTVCLIWKTDCQNSA